MQFQVPQFIETEDKIVGPFSIRQFIYVAIAGAISAMLYFSVGGIVWVVGSVLVLGLAGAMSFVKINGRPFLDVMLAAANFYWKPQTYIWKPDHVGAPQKQRLMSSEPQKFEASIDTARRLAAGSSLHTTLTNLQTGEKPGKQSDREFLDRKMEQRYQIFRRDAGDRQVARRIDYR